MSSFNEDQLLTVVVEGGIMKLRTPGGYVIKRIIGTLVDHDVNSKSYPLAYCSFAGFIDSFGPIFLCDDTAPKYKDGKLIAPDGEEIYLTGGFDIHGADEKELAYYEARSWVKLADTI